MEISTDIFVGSFLALRERLGQLEGLDKKLSQEKTAARIGCSHAAYRKWEDGTIPGGYWMLKILMACPDKQTFDKFFLDIAKPGDNIRSTSRPKVPIQPIGGAQPGAPQASVKTTSRYLKSRPKKR